MKKIQLALLLISLLILGACSDSSKSEEASEVPEVVEDEKIGFSITGDSIEEAENIPETEKEDILQAFDTYISTFNEKDWDAYLDMISDNSESFDKEEEMAYIETIFADFDLVREPSNTTIVKYKEDEAQVFSTLGHKLKQLETGLEKEESARQVTVFAKENGAWKVKSVHSIGENPAKK